MLLETNCLANWFNWCNKKRKVDPIILKVGGRLFPGPTQLLPENGNGIDGQDVLDSLVCALKGCLPNPDGKLVTTAETWLHREFRHSTRNLLVGVANSLHQIMPNDWKMSDCIPSPLLQPAGSAERLPLLQQEIEILSAGRLTNRDLFFIWSEQEGTMERKIDFYPDPRSFFRLSFSGDEGTEEPFLN